MIFCEFVCWFAIYSFFGWVFECVYYSLLDQKLVNSGFLRGPYCPVYGAGAMAVILTLGKLNNPIVIFFLSILVAGSVEYFTSWLFEKLFHARWWDYSDMPFNIHGRVFLLSLLAFGIGSIFGVLWMQPGLRAFTRSLPSSMVCFFAGAFVTALCVDFVSTVFRLRKPKRRLADRANELYQAALKACKPLRMARVVMEKVIWGKRPVKNHGGPTVSRRDDTAKERSLDKD